MAHRPHRHGSCIGKTAAGEQEKHSGAATDGYSLRGHFWIDGPEGTFLGFGRVVLMERIIEHGSITRAAKSMDMSYRHAWVLIESMNRQSPNGKPFVIRQSGGKGGGGTSVTAEGRLAIKEFHRLHARFIKHLEKEMKTLSFLKELT